MKIESFGYTGEGMSRVYENGQWTVGIKNYKPANDKSLFNELERHNETDELFVLTAGACTCICRRGRWGNEVRRRLHGAGKGIQYPTGAVAQYHHGPGNQDGID